MDVLPDALTLEVLSRLPVKTIIQCKSVCKKWRDLVSAPYFVHLHLLRSRECLLINRHCRILDWMEIENKVGGSYTLNHVKSLKEDILRCPIQVNSVNGLICVYNVDQQDSTYVFNPVVGEHIMLPKPQQLGLVTCGYGFGVSSAGEYKVIRICGRLSSSSLVPRTVSTVELEVYTLGMDQWRRLGKATSHLNLRGLLWRPGVFLNGHVYWIADMGQIYDFDLNTETDMVFPSPPGDHQNHDQMLGVLKGSLSKFSWSSSGFTLWLMKEAWHKEITIQKNIDRRLRSQGWTPWYVTDGFKGNKTVIICTTETGKLVAYCLNTDKTLPLKLHRGYFMTVIPYRPSLLKLQNIGSQSL